MPNGIVHHWYGRLIDENRNYVRWIEYSVSAALMMVLVARFAGIADLAALIGVFALTTSMILFGLLMERQQRPGSADWSAFWFGSLAGAVPWAAVAIYLVNGASPPGFVYAIVAVQFVFFFSFAVNVPSSAGSTSPRAKVPRGASTTAFFFASNCLESYAALNLALSG